ncbi:hypothetical protein SAMD00019534_115980, partial [Acytostelium subglobosum LB1]|uniref:hypothetical protein n=1 Tax=Acytostelium subglobosum LB1 TaxID=1410327 RepID=UPI0006449BD2
MGTTTTVIQRIRRIVADECEPGLWDKMDRDANECPIAYIFNYLLTQMTDEGDRDLMDDTPLTGVFYNPQGIRPAISVVDYLKRLVQYLGCSKSCFIIALVYLDRLIVEKNYILNSLNVHRIIFGCILISIKFCDDYYYPHDVYSVVGGLTLEEVNGIERRLLEDLQFDLCVHEDVFTQYLIMDLKGYLMSDIMNQQEEPEESDGESDCESDSSNESKHAAGTVDDHTSSSVVPQVNLPQLSPLPQQAIPHTSMSKSSATLDIPPRPFNRTKSRTLSNSFDMDTILKKKFPQPLYISPQLKDRYRRNSYNHSLILNKSSSLSSQSSPGHNNNNNLKDV